MTGRELPVRRPRRLRHSAPLRSLVRETRLSPEDMIYPLFVRHGDGPRREIESMPGCAQLSVDGAVEEAARAEAAGVRAVLLFGIPSVKDAVGSESHAEDGIVQQAVRAIKAALPGMLVVTDVCLCEYTDHGHCGLLNPVAERVVGLEGLAGLAGDEGFDEPSDEGGSSRGAAGAVTESRGAGPRGGLAEPNHRHLPAGYVLNDETLAVLGRIAVSHALAGADIVAPSGMLDGMVRAIRSDLDAVGLQHTAIMSYAVKYASGFYGPFREAAEGAPRAGDRKTHQMDPANAREALREARIDLEEGADMLMVKPALAYLDVIHRVRSAVPELPLVAYNVSGEYSMVKAAADRGWLDERTVVLEALVGMKRAGADLIITYHAVDAASWLN